MRTGSEVEPIDLEASRSSSARAQRREGSMLVLDDLGLCVRIGHCRCLLRDRAQDLALIELVDLLVECDAMLGEKVTPGNDRVFVELDVLHDEHELFVRDDGTVALLPRGDVSIEVVLRHAPSQGALGGLTHHGSRS